MQLTIADAHKLATRALVRHALPIEHAEVVADHLLDAALCGHEFSSLPRLLAIIGELKNKAPAQPIQVTREDGPFAHLDGGDTIGYVVSVAAIDKAIELCAQYGVAVVTAHNTWFSGRCAYYVERAARQGYIALHTTNSTARVAPFGGARRMMGTNPFAIAFPGVDDPVIIDIGTSAITWGDVVLAKAKGEALPPNVAVGPDAQPTQDPDAALAGAFYPWGGQRGSALALVVQILGMLAGSAPIINDTGNYGLFFLVFDPKRAGPGIDFAPQVSRMREIVTSMVALAGHDGVRMPGDGSLARRKLNLAAGVIGLDDRIYQQILDLSR
jgi:LDH2 family malate/lactate/ureidoglycolate dehydrogenase